MVQLLGHDRVAVLDAGRIIELGAHEELAAQGGTYSRLWRSWQPSS